MSQREYAADLLHSDRLCAGDGLLRRGTPRRDRPCRYHAERIEFDLFFYHPDVSARSLGVASVLFEIEWGAAPGLHAHVSRLSISACPSTAYKSHYGPHELLHGRPGESDEPMWVAADRGRGMTDEDGCDRSNI